jgi:AcrR family transcriptional regulator
MTELGDRPAPLIWSQAQPLRRRTLGGEAIVGAAIAVADEGGTAALTMAAVAHRLGPYSPMALYRHVPSKDGMVDLMLDAAMAEVPVPERPSGDWRADLRDLALHTWAMVRRHGWYAELVHTRPPAGPHVMRRTEFMLEVLTGEGLPVGAALTYAALVDRHVYGSGLQDAEERRQLERYGADSPEGWMAAIAPVRELAAASGRLPLLTSWLSAPTGPDPDEQFELGLGCLLDGIAGRLVA